MGALGAAPQYRQRRCCVGQRPHPARVVLVTLAAPVSAGMPVSRATLPRPALGPPREDDLCRPLFGPEVAVTRGARPGLAAGQ